MRGFARWAGALALLTVGPPPAPAQVSPPVRAPGSAPVKTPVPWKTGEYLEYDVKFGPLTAGSGRMHVLGTDTIRGRTAWRLRFNVTGGVWPIRVNDSYDSWMDVETLNSLRFVQDLHEANRRTHRDYRIEPERAVYQQVGKEERESVRDPLDDAAFFYFVRTIPLVVGEKYDFHRYFDPRANPVTILVLRKDSVRVPAGRFAAIVIQPIIKTSGLFSENGSAEIWLSDDEHRILLQMKTKLSIGSLNLYLKRIRMSADSAAPAGSAGSAAPGPGRQ